MGCVDSDRPRVLFAEERLDGGTKRRCDAHCYIDRWGGATRLDGTESLPGHPDETRQLCLCHLDLLAAVAYARAGM